MKNKLSFISIFTLCIALSLTACGGKQSSNTDSKNTQTEAGSEASGKSDSKLDDLYQQENQLFADHADVWNKAFGMMNKSDADPNGNYADYLAGTVESNKDSFTDDELKTLNEDIETIRKIEEQIAELKTKINHQTITRRTALKPHLYSVIFPVRILMAIRLMTACFPVMQ